MSAPKNQKNVSMMAGLHGVVSDEVERSGVPSSVCETGPRDSDQSMPGSAERVWCLASAYHLLCDVSVLYHFCELVEVELAVAVLVGLHHRYTTPPKRNVSQAATARPDG
jgi:hypothetical protein